MNKLSALFLVSSFIFCTSAYCHEHQVGEMTGDAIRISEFDHGLAGNFGKTLLLFSMNAQPKGLQLSLRKSGAFIEGAFAISQSGSRELSFVRPQDGSTYTVALTHIDTEKQIFTYSILDSAKRSYTASLSVEAPIADGHFQNPVFKLGLRGKSFRIAFRGESCWNYTALIGLTLLSAALVEHPVEFQ